MGMIIQSQQASRELRLDTIQELRLRCFPSRGIYWFALLILNQSIKKNIMNTLDNLGVVTVLLERLEKQRLPTALAIKEKVDNGQCLEDFDIDFLKEIFSDAQNIMPKVQQHPEYLELVGKVIDLYHDITEKALQNQSSTK